MALISNADRLAVRWTIGHVRDRGYEMLRLSIVCAVRLFGTMARYVVYVNVRTLDEVRELTGPVPDFVEWRQVTARDVPLVLRKHFDDTLIEGMGWKLVPLRCYPDRYELALDNDCIIWSLPEGMAAWLSSAEAFLFAEDVDRALGSFDHLCRPGNLNAGIRGLPPHVDLESDLAYVLDHRSELVVAEIEEQGLQAAAISRRDPLFLVRNTEVTICSPFWPRSPELGTCGAHFVGMNAASIPWNYYDRPADAWLTEFWARHRPALYAKAGLTL